MASSERSSPSPAPKSKNQRIRDNQRRSRTRRQEYLADLERRLRTPSYANREAITRPTQVLLRAKLTKTAPLGRIGERIHLQKLATRYAFGFESARRRQLLPCAVPLLRRSNNEHSDARGRRSRPTDDESHLVSRSLVGEWNFEEKESVVFGEYRLQRI